MKQLKFDSQLKPEDMYRFQMYHAYTSFQGWSAILFGILGISAGIITFGKVDTFYTVAYIVLGVVFLLYLPVIFKSRSKRLVESSEVLSNVLHYQLTEDGILVSTDVKPENGEEPEPVLLPWKNVYKVVTTKQELFIFSTRINAYVIPKTAVEGITREIGDFFRAKLPPHRLKYRW